jgi:hypothetical protein
MNLDRSISTSQLGPQSIDQPLSSEDRWRDPRAGDELIRSLGQYYGRCTSSWLQRSQRKRWSLLKRLVKDRPSHEPNAALTKEMHAIQRDLRFVTATRQIPFGDPWKKEAVVGPMISPEHAARAQAWVEEAAAGGARVLVGGRRQGAGVEPTILAGVKPTMRVACQEAFAPLGSIFEFDYLDDAYQQVNATPFGLAAGLFTNDVRVALSAGRRLRFGGVHINETSSSRVDVMPFGGV